jgi:hypothetical protein
MNFHDWLEKLTSTIRSWKGSTNLQILRETVLPPTPAGTFQHHRCPSEIFGFYATAAAACDISYVFRIPESYLENEGEQYDALPKRMMGGLNILGLEEALKLRDELEGIIKAAGSHRSKNVTNAIAVVQSAYIIWRGLGSDCLALVSKNPILPEGLYLIPYPFVMEPKKYIRYADSFIQWLQFLENNLYLGPEWSHIEVFHDGTRLESKEALCRDLLHFIKQR